MKCEHCQKELNKSKRFCSLSCSNKARPSRKKIWNKICEYCSSEFEVNSQTKNKKFCNHSCAASKNNTGLQRHGESKRQCVRCTLDISRRSKSQFCSYVCKINHWADDKLIIQSEGLSAQFRDFLLEKANYKCSQCSWSKLHPITNKYPLQVDHIDGNSRNNSISNLRVLCPNCHSLTSTYGILNKGNGRINRYK